MTPDFELWQQERIRMRQYNMTAGAILGGLLAALLVVFFATSTIFTSLPLVVTVTTLFGVAYSVRQARFRLKWFYFPKALSVGLSTGIYASLFVGVTWYAYICLFNTDFIAQFLSETGTSLIQLIPESTGATEAEEMRQAITRSMEEARTATTPMSFALGQACNTMLWSGFAALVAALIYKYKRPRTSGSRNDLFPPQQPSTDLSGENNSAD